MFDQTVEHHSEGKVTYKIYRHRLLALLSVPPLQKGEFWCVTKLNEFTYLYLAFITYLAKLRFLCSYFLVLYSLKCTLMHVVLFDLLNHLERYGYSVNPLYKEGSQSSDSVSICQQGKGHLASLTQAFPAHLAGFLRH